MPWLCGKRFHEAKDVNIGGKLFPMAFAALSKCPRLMSVAKRDRDGAWFIDRNGLVYEYILPFLVEGKLSKHPADQIARALLLREAEFLGLTELMTIVASHVGAPMPANEDARLMRLRTFQSALQHGGSESLDNITGVVAALHQSKTALLSFVDRTAHVCVSRMGFEHASRPRSYSFCAHALDVKRADRILPLVVNDATKDGRFQNNPLVLGEPHVRSYAGFPLVTSDGFSLGALCTMDTKPRQYSKGQLQILANLSHIAMLELEGDQLLEKEVEEPDFDVTSDSTASALRVLRMQQAATQLVALVHIGAHGAVDYKLLYTNSVWSSTVGVKLTPPRDFRDVAKVDGPGVPWGASNEPDCGPLLWHWLQLSGESEDDFDARLREQWQHGSSLSNIIVKGTLRSAPGMPRQRVIGRIVEATVPLDISIAVDADDTHGPGCRAPGALDGRYAFVLLHPDMM
eukprot:TRINITY_DN4421_c0_g1_i1.p1 TRINITY_DN4421_c0_g1~~TRINITY_DN4421_c0_g1_i1.p1  ORF type:complete len:459 (+),score=54.78 TRINITY_DN4421_c0_g1_i1:100-1476(+)